MSVRPRCPQCQRPAASCYCARIPHLHNRWPVRILQHPLEARHALGTARIAALGLSNCELATGTSLELTFPDWQDCVLLYPGPDSQPLAGLLTTPSRPLLFVDATWRKSRRMLLESAALAALPRFHLENPRPSRYRIRREPNDAAVSTLEAIVQSLEVLEATPGRYAGLLEVMDTLVDEQIRHMGPQVYEQRYADAFKAETQWPRSRRRSAESESAECSDRSPDRGGQDH